MERKSFVFYLDWADDIADQPEEVRLEVLEGVVRYAATGEVGDVSPVSRALLKAITRTIDRDGEKRERVIERRREAGRKGAYVTNILNRQKAANSANDDFARQRSANSAVSVSDSVSVSVSDSVSTDVDDKKEKEKTSFSKKKSATINYAEAVTMTEAEHKALEEKHGARACAWMVDRLNNYKLSTGKQYKSDYRAILTWVVDSYFEAHRSEKRPAEVAAKGGDGTTTAETLRLGPGERVEADGRRTYGSGVANIPYAAPPRPSERYTWNAENETWIFM